MSYLVNLFFLVQTFEKFVRIIEHHAALGSRDVFITVNHARWNNNQEGIVHSCEIGHYIPERLALFSVIPELDLEVTWPYKGEYIGLLSVLMGATCNSRLCIGYIAHLGLYFIGQRIHPKGFDQITTPVNMLHKLYHMYSINFITFKAHPFLPSSQYS